MNSSFRDCQTNDTQKWKMRKKTYIFSHVALTMERKRKRRRTEGERKQTNGAKRARARETSHKKQIEQVFLCTAAITSDFVNRHKKNKEIMIVCLPKYVLKQRARAHTTSCSSTFFSACDRISTSLGRANGQPQRVTPFERARAPTEHRVALLSASNNIVFTFLSFPCSSACKFVLG